MRNNVKAIVRLLAIILVTSFLTFLAFGLVTQFFYAIASTKRELMVP